jgi:eukaryotic-like serine/threonine-protein kinase
LLELLTLLEKAGHGRPSTAPPSVGRGERRLVTILLAERVPGDEPTDGDGYLALKDLEVVRKVSAEHGAYGSPLQGGGLLLVVSGRGNAHDQAVDAANCALALRRAVPTIRTGCSSARPSIAQPP